MGEETAITKKDNFQIVCFAILLILSSFTICVGATINNSPLPQTNSVNSSAVVSAVKSGTTSTSSWSVGPTPNPIGTTVNVDVRIDKTESVWGWEIANLNWTSRVFNITKIKEGSFLKNTDNTLFIGSASNLFNQDNVDGYLKGGVGCALQDRTEVSHDSSGVLVTLTFIIVGSGEGSITMSDVNLRSTALDSTGTNATVDNALIDVLGANGNSTNGNQGANIDVFTDKGGQGIGVNSGDYGPLDLVNMFALVTYDNAPVSNINVAFTISYNNGTLYELRVANTNSTGYASAVSRLPAVSDASSTLLGNWSITASANVSDTAVRDTLGFVFSYLDIVSQIRIPSSVHIMGDLPVQATVINLDNSTQWSKIDFTLFDKAQVPIGFYEAANTSHKQNQTITANIPISSYAFTGQATVYISLLSANGAALAPDSVSSFQVLPSASIEANNIFASPEYALGALVALSATLGAFLAYNVIRKRSKSTIHLSK